MSTLSSAPSASEFSSRSWRAELRLDIAFCPRTQRTIIQNTHRRGPLTLQRPFYPEGKPCHIYLLHPPGGIVGGDQLSISARLGGGSHTLLTMPGAGKFYRSDGRRASLTQRFALAEQAVLEWLPQQTIFFDKAQASLATEFMLSSNSRLLGWDMVSLGRPALGEYFKEGQIATRLRIRLPGSCGLSDGLRLDAGSVSHLYGWRYIGCFFAWPTRETHLEMAREVLKHWDMPCGATRLDELLMVRVLSHDNLSCEKLFLQLWKTLRTPLLNIRAEPPRIWAT